MTAGEQFHQGFVDVNPNSKIPCGWSDHLFKQLSVQRLQLIGSTCIGTTVCAPAHARMPLDTVINSKRVRFYPDIDSGCTATATATAIARILYDCLCATGVDHAPNDAGDAISLFESQYHLCHIAIQWDEPFLFWIRDVFCAQYPKVLGAKHILIHDFGAILKKRSAAIMCGVTLPFCGTNQLTARLHCGGMCMVHGAWTAFGGDRCVHGNEPTCEY